MHSKPTQLDHAHVTIIVPPRVPLLGQAALPGSGIARLAHCTQCLEAKQAAAHRYCSKGSAGQGSDAEVNMLIAHHALSPLSCLYSPLQCRGQLLHDGCSSNVSGTGQWGPDPTSAA